MMKLVKKFKFYSTVNILILTGIIILINIISQFYFSRIDLTKDKRYSLSDISKKQLKNLDDIIFIRVYLDGELPAGFRMLRESTKEILDEFVAYGGKKIEYEFIDPSSAHSNQEKREIYKQLSEQGIEPLNLEVVSSKDKKTQKIIFPGAIVTYKNKSVSLSLLQQQMGVEPDVVINNSIISLEYQFMNAFRKLTAPRKLKIAFIEGHGELDERHSWDIFRSLSDFYDVERVNLPRTKVGYLNLYDLIVIAKPDSVFNKLEKYKIDQFVMKGGKVLWLIDKLAADMDSLDENGVTTTMEFPIDLDDILFHYGVRINSDLVQDLQCHLIPVIINKGSNQQDFRPWTFYPLVVSLSSNPIVNNLNAVWFRFANSIDTVGSPNIKKTILLQSSYNCRLLPNPVMISIQQISEQVNEAMYQSGPKNLAVLLEGTFTSIYRNRISPQTLESGDYGKFKEVSKPTKMIVISDGDVISNMVSKIREQTYPLGYDRYTNQSFGNKTFVLNCIDYLIDNSGVMQLRTKHFQLRLLNKSKIKTQKLEWQVINMGVPVLFIILFGFIYSYIRKQKYSVKKTL
jgi:ABC-2 type transport system permease protein